MQLNPLVQLKQEVRQAAQFCWPTTLKVPVLQTQTLAARVRELVSQDRQLLGLAPEQDRQVMSQARQVDPKENPWMQLHYWLTLSVRMAVSQLRQVVGFAQVRQVGRHAWQVGEVPSS